MYHNEVPIICDMKIYDVIRGDVYRKDGKIVKVQYYNNGLVSESVNGDVINRRIIYEEEKLDIKTEYKKVKEFKEKLRSYGDIEEARKKAMEVKELIESFI